MTAPHRPTPSLLDELQDRLILPGMLRFTKLGYAWRKRSWVPLTVCMRGRTVVVTGATSGLGEATARQIAALGARVVIVGRSREKAEASRKAIVAASGNDNVGVALADLSLLHDVRKLARRLLESEPHIHVLVNNAGVLLNERTMTAEGNETSLATNLLAPFLLTQLLIPRLKASAPARIINVSSGGMYTSGLALDDLQYENGTYRGSMAYERHAPRLGRHTRRRNLAAGLPLGDQAVASRRGRRRGHDHLARGGTRGRRRHGWLLARSRATPDARPARHEPQARGEAPLVGCVGGADREAREGEPARGLLSLPDPTRLTIRA